MQDQQQGGEEGHRIDGPELVFEGEIANPGTHDVLLLARTVLARCQYFLTGISYRN
ncbi:hypothetical protein D3C76_1821810 [compost metagenome]